MNHLKLTAFALIAVCCLNAAAQTTPKPPLDTAAFRTWQQVDNAVTVSPDKRYVAYLISSPQPKTIFQSVKPGWQAVYPSANAQVAISAGSRYAVFLQRDTLRILTLGQHAEKSIAGVSRFELAGNYLYYFLRSGPPGLHITDLEHQRETEYPGIEDLTLAWKNGAILSGTANGLHILSLVRGDRMTKPFFTGTGSISRLWKPEDLRAWYFIVTQNGQPVLYRWNEDDKEAAACSAGGLPAGELTRVSPDGRWLVFTEESTPAAASQPGSNLVIWNYLDPVRKQRRGLSADTATRRIYAYNVETGSKQPLSSGRGSLLGLSGTEAVVSHWSGPGTDDEKDWNAMSQFETRIISLASGRVTTLKDEEVALAPGGRFVYYRRDEDKTHWLLDLATGQHRSLNAETEKISGSKRDWYRSYAKWLPGGRTLLLADHYDLWLIDPASPEKNRPLTKGSGMKNRLVFSLFEARSGSFLLSALSEVSGDHGFYRAFPGGGKPPQLLHMAACKYQRIYPGGADVYSFLRTRADRAPELVITTDLQHFKTIGSVQPQRPYNWLKTEFHHYPGSRGRELSGVLYQPENFDPARKYPVIFSYYQRLQDVLHDFPDPKLNRGQMNIPWMVSRGYLVFIPDITTLPDRPGLAALDDINAAADYVSHLPFADSTRMGITGHSFGGYETSFLVTHTSRFAAAYAGAPATDLVSLYELLGGSSGAAVYHNGQLRIQSLMWEDPRPWIANSPVFFVHRVSTPLLMMGNEGDFLWPQAPEIMNAMRRLGKPCWMLQYKNGGHTVSEADGMDLTLRVQQFFDHYLKGAPAPAWMETPGSLEMKPTPKAPAQPERILSPEAKRKAEELLLRPPVTVTF